MQANTVKPGAHRATLDDQMLVVAPGTERGALRHSLDAIPVARSIAVVLDTRRDREVPGAVINLARRCGSHIILYDVSTGSLWTTPFEYGDAGKRFRDQLLSASQLRYLGQHGAARAVHEVNKAGGVATAFLAGRPKAGDLSDLVRRERIDLVLAIGLPHGKAAQNAHRVRAFGATLVECGPNGRAAVYPPCAVDDPAGLRAQQQSSSWWVRVVRRGRLSA